VIGHREEAASISEAQARENAAPLTTAILASDRPEPSARDPDSRIPGAAQLV
jgi:hypothetical protein